MGQRLVVHFPGQQGAFHGSGGNGALDDHGFRVQTVRQCLAAGTGDVACPFDRTAQSLYNVLQWHPGPHDATSGANRPLGATCPVREKRPAVTGTLQDRRNGGYAHLLQVTDCQGSGVFDALDPHLPDIRVFSHRGRWCRQVVAYEQTVTGGDDAVADGPPLGFHGVGAVNDQGVAFLPGRVIRQRFWLIGLGQGRKPQHGNRRHGAGAAKQQGAPGSVLEARVIRATHQSCFLLHDPSPF